VTVRISSPHVNSAMDATQVAAALNVPAEAVTNWGNGYAIVDEDKATQPQPKATKPKAKRKPKAKAPKPEATPEAIGQDEAPEAVTEVD